MFQLNKPVIHRVQNLLKHLLRLQNAISSLLYSLWLPVFIWPWSCTPPKSRATFRVKRELLFPWMYITTINGPWSVIKRSGNADTLRKFLTRSLMQLFIFCSPSNSSLIDSFYGLPIGQNVAFNRLSFGTRRLPRWKNMRQSPWQNGSRRLEMPLPGHLSACFWVIRVLL